MDLLTTVATRGAFELFLAEDGLPTALTRMNLGAQIADFSSIKLARDKRSAFWSKVSQIESEYNEVHTRFVAKCKGRVGRWQTFRRQDLENIARNLLCLLAICYKSLDEEAHMEGAMERWERLLLEVEFDTADIFLMTSFIGPAYALLDSGFLLRQVTPLFIEEEDFGEFRTRLRAMTEFDFDSLFLERS